MSNRSTCHPNSGGSSTSPVGLLAEVRSRYLAGAPRNQLFCELILDSMHRSGVSKPTVLDIGCGHGLDGSTELQRAIALETGQFIGIEPDPDIAVPEHFSEAHCCVLENAPLAPESVHVAYSAFVLEHVTSPGRFWNTIHRALVPGGVAWGFTVDARHPFRIASSVLDRLQLKDAYLTLLRGQRGAERYENYPAYYRTNTPGQIRAQTRQFRHASFLSLHREGQLDYYLPRSCRWFVHWLERASIGLGLPGSMLVVRLVK